MILVWFWISLCDDLLKKSLKKSPNLLSCFSWKWKTWWKHLRQKKGEQFLRQGQNRLKKILVQQIFRKLFSQNIPHRCVKGSVFVKGSATSCMGMSKIPWWPSGCSGPLSTGLALRAATWISWWIYQTNTLVKSTKRMKPTRRGSGKRKRPKPQKKCSKIIQKSSVPFRYDHWPNKNISGIHICARLVLKSYL